MNEEPTLGNPLQTLLELPAPEKTERGLQHTPREIWQQPETWRATYQLCRSLVLELSTALDRAGLDSGRQPQPTVYLIGAGSSDYVGRALAPLLRRRWGCEVWAIPSTTMLSDGEQYHRPDRQYLWISFSRSGDSPEGVALLERALERDRHIQHLVITCNQQGKMAQLCARHSDRAFALVLDDRVNDRGLAMTSSFTNMVVAGQCVANLEQIARYGEILERMAEAGGRLLPSAAETASEIASQGCTRACFVGTGALRAVADESALKLVELTAGRVVTMAESALGLRHGPMSAVDHQTLFVAFLSGEARNRGYERDLLAEISRKGLGKTRLVVTNGAHKGENEIGNLADYVCPLNLAYDFSDDYRPPLDTMIGQLLGLFFSLNHGIRPDEPSPTGAITRVVLPITLYS